MNILITSAGRRNYLVEYFKAALGGRGLVMAADASPYAPALYTADMLFLVPAATEQGHIEALLDVCRANHVELLLSVNDLELPSLAASRALFATIGTHVLISRPEVIATCHDKLRTALFLGEHSIESPRTVDTAIEARALLEAGELRFPLVVKPRFGSASIGFEIVDNASQLHAALTLAGARARRDPNGISVHHGAKPAVVQEFVSGQEFGLDILNDLDGQYIATVVKKKLTMRAGETDRAVTVHDNGLESVGARIGQALQHVGVLDCDLIVSGGRAIVLDMNPRFGGGYPFSHAAGINMPAAVISWLRHEEPDPAWFKCRPDIASAKYDMLTRVRGHIGKSEPTESWGR